VILYIDPGLRACGCALFAGGRLVAAGLPAGSKDASTDTPHGRPFLWSTMASAVAEWCRGRGEITGVVIELPQVRKREHQRAAKKGTDPNDLIQLAAVVAAISDRFRDSASVGGGVRAFLPEEWKGTIPKKIHHERALARLDAAELAAIPQLASSKLHNVLDAVALGLVDSKRL